MGLRDLHPDLAKKAREELGEDVNPMKIYEDFEMIRTWASKQPHLYNIRTNDQWLATYLRGCKFSMEKVKRKLEMFNTMRAACPELVTGLNPFSPIMQDLLNRGVCFLLPKTEKPDDPRVIIIRTGAYDFGKIQIDDLIRLHQLVTLYALHEDDQGVIAGFVYIVDVANTNADIMQYIKLSNFKKLSMLNEDALPTRHRGAHYINPFPAAEAVFNIFKKFLNEKSKSRFFVHHDMNGLYKYVPRSILPTEYGGDSGSIQEIRDEMKKNIENFKHWYDEDMAYKSDESRRPGMPKTAESLLGIDGSFRRLEVD